MTAVRNFPDSPLRLQPAVPMHWHTPAWLISFWDSLEAYGRRRAVRELEHLALHREAHDPEMARQFRRVAAECRGPSTAQQGERSRS